MTRKKPGTRYHLVFLTIYIAGWLFVLFVNGALPYVASPTMGQAVWTTGFSQSFINDSIFTIHARNFGAPLPAAIAFGLAGAWPAGIFIGLGMHAADAYSLMIAFWISVGFASAFKVARFLGATPKLSVLAALAWGTMPMVWNHSGYSMLSTGIALLPLYVLVTLKLFTVKKWPEISYAEFVYKIFVPYLVVCLIAVFMDGYTFVMFAVGSTVLGVLLYFRAKAGENLFIRLVIHVFSFVFAYYLYSTYTGDLPFTVETLDFFRGWGADLTFFTIPTAGIHWLLDILGWSLPRSEESYYGDASVWITTFCFPLILGAVLSVFITDKHHLKLGFIVIALFGFYMSLGPSLKINAVKPDPGMGQLMEEKYAVAPTGSAVLSTHLPGFRNMRASYHWAALGCLGSWVLIVIALSSTQRQLVQASAAVTLFIVIVLNLPDITQKHALDKNHRSQFLAIDADLVESMRSVIKPGEKVIFLPWRNDFLVNYLAARLNVKAYNIGGDKNLAGAHQCWPEALAAIPMGEISGDLSKRVGQLLNQGVAQVVILPFIDMLWAANQWPYPLLFKDGLAATLLDLRQSGEFLIDERDYYAAVRLKPAFTAINEPGNLHGHSLPAPCSPPDCLELIDFDVATPTEVGIFVDGRIKSTGKPGYLVFGPYEPLESGCYTLTVNGLVKNYNGAWVDMVSEKGTVLHAKFPLREHGSNGFLIDEKVYLNRLVCDMEVRVFVNKDEDITLEGYRVSPLKEDCY